MVVPGMLYYVVECVPGVVFGSEFWWGESQPDGKSTEANAHDYGAVKTALVRQAIDGFP